MQRTLSFLSDLSQNNSRDWFQANKEVYDAAHEEMIAFADKLLSEMNSHDVIGTPSGRKSLYRIYRDVRFSKDKTPYKTHWAGRMRRAGAERRGGYYYKIGLKESYAVGGFFGPNAKDLLHFRNQIALDADPLRSILESKAFKTTFGELQGEQLKTAPKGFEKDHPEIDLLRYKQYFIRHDFTQEQVLDADFPKTVSETFRKMRPFFDCMTEMITTDLNGIPLV
ncbi:DUF2461 domain-containing protein [Ekhidna sp.]|uniref:DUF2461 domain-containing protein n=1 Tax=Ekhidna sp. TaxID=2608089 RepID=UPI003CCBBCBF